MKLHKKLHKIIAPKKQPLKSHDYQLKYK